MGFIMNGSVCLTNKKIDPPFQKVIYVKTTANVRVYLVLVSIKDLKCGIIWWILVAATLAVATSRSYS